MRTVYVNPVQGNDTARGTINAPFKTISHSLKLATSGTIIRLSPGTYDLTSGEIFPLLVPPEVIILGHEPSKGKEVIIYGGGKYTSSSFGSQNITLLLGNQCQLLGVTVTNPLAKGTGVWIESTDPLVANNTFSKCGREGILVTGKSKPVVRDNLLVQNAASGISVGRNSKGEICHNICRSTGYGISVSDYGAPLISDNQLISNLVGMQFTRSAKPVLRRNLVEKNRQAGIIIAGDAVPDLGSEQDPAGNIIRGNGDFDLSNRTSGNLTSVGNQLNPAKIQGRINLAAAEVENSGFGPRQFSDVTNHWAANFIEELVNRQLISGFPNGTFRPEDNLTRAQYAALIAKSFNLPRQVGTTGGNFRDIPQNFWAAEPISKAVAMGFLSGYPDGTFRPQQNLTRVQAFVSLVNGLGLRGGNSNLLLTYRDRALIPSYATNAVATATQKRFVINYPQPDLLEPARDITRAEISAILYQALVSTSSNIQALSSPYILNPEPFVASFSDIESHWAAEFITPLAERDLVSGFADGTFKPDASLNRAQFAALLVKVFDPAPIRPATQFIDLAPDFWATDAIQQAYRAGFISGFPDQTFHPDQKLRRIHLIVALVSGLNLSPREEELLGIYTDKEEIPAYARGAVAAATQASIVVNYPHPKELQSLRETTRGEATAMVYQALVYQRKISGLSSPYIAKI